MKLTWRKYHDCIFGPSYRLEGLPCRQDCGIAHRRGDKSYIANACIGGQYLFFVVLALLFSCVVNLVQIVVN